MSKSLVLGNGNILVGLDSSGQVRDFYFPYIGIENHVGGGHLHRIGVWVDGTVSWLESSDWIVRVNCEREAFVGTVEAENKKLGISLHLSDVVYNERNIFVRRIVVKNLSSHERLIRVFMCHEFEMYEARRGDTAYFDPINHVVVHYKGRRVFVANTRCDGVPFDDYAVGVYGIEGKDGTWRDAEDGVLSKNAIEHGPTDSVMCVSMIIPGKSEKQMYYWIAVAESIHEALDLNDYVLGKGPEHLIKTTTDFWHAWVNKYQFNFYDLPDEVVSLFKKSLFMIRAHVDTHGAIIASSDSDIFQGGKDTYAYMWPRDASFASTALDVAGDPNVAARFFEFCNDVVHDDGYFMHKYRPDKSLGSSWHPWVHDGKVQLPIQEDETALVIIALWKHYELSRDLEFVEKVYRYLIERTANFLLGFRDFKTGLPKPSYDLWEERLGIHTFTACSVYGALKSAAKFANLLGKSRAEQNYSHTADEIRDAIMRHMYDNDTGAFYRMVEVTGGEIKKDKTIDASSAYGAFAFGVLDVGEERLERAMKKTREALWCNTKIGGIARYENDWFNRVDKKMPGNPWFVTTLWLAEYDIAAAKKKSDLQRVRTTLEWVAQNAVSSGVLPEQINPHSGAPVSAAPLTWSHAQFVIAIIQYLNRLEQLKVCENCNPVK